NLSEFLEKLFSTSTKSNFTLQNPHNEGMDELGFGKSGMVMNSELISWKRNRMLSVLLLMNASYLKNQVNLTQKLCWLDTKVHLLSQYLFDNEKQDDITQNSSKVNYNDVTDDVIRSNLIEVFISEIDTAESSLSFIMYYLSIIKEVSRIIPATSVIFRSNVSEDDVGSYNLV
ncbi:4637_t:CDS:2, partial [Funneliformis geosporum]